MRIPNTITVEQLSETIGKSAMQIRRYRQSGILPFHKIGATVYFTQEDLERFYNAPEFQCTYRARAKKVGTK